MKFSILFSTITGKSAVHAVGCRCAVKKQGLVIEKVDAPSPEKAASEFFQAEQLGERGYAKTTVSPCANRGPKVLAEMLRF